MTRRELLERREAELIRQYSATLLDEYTKPILAELALIQCVLGANHLTLDNKVTLKPRKT